MAECASIPLAAPGRLLLQISVWVDFGDSNVNVSLALPPSPV